MGGWRDMSAEALEDQYSPSRWSPRLDRDTIIDAHLAVTAAGTERARASAQTSLHVPYGKGDGEKLDIYFPTDHSGTFPVLVYIHGGYWQCLSKDESGFAAPPLVSQGVAVVAVGYDTAPRGHMDTMVLQVRRSLAFLVEQYPEIREVAQRNSPMRHVAPAVPAACEVLVVVAQHDSPEFRRQSQEYSQALRAAGWSVSLLDLAGVDHFDVIEKLSENSYILTQVILNMISRA
ncbi:kynurenine formamidase isoform X4 [Pseudopipra pipra]|uniref:kynurenine formamidase isoform X4 n=1 Tax=Pseudopipra pipra TaxID=415032 RepID=UPI00313A1C44